MTEDSGKLVPQETRRPLGDVTNLSNKRGISSILGESGKSVVAHEGSRVKFSKRLCLVVDDLVNESCKGSSSDDKNSSGDSEEISPGDAKALKEIYFEPGDRDGAREVTADQTHLVTGQALALSTQSRNSLVTGEELRKCHNFEMRRCSNEHVNQNLEDDLLRSCSCSFCVKAAYMWSDLHYQDIKGRLSVLKKSQKEASNLIQRNDKERPREFRASSKLESELKGQWRSLFVNMGEILAHESNNLQKSFLRMKELRENCKMDVEKSMKTPPQNTKK